jgi:hypothetical protein
MAQDSPRARVRARVQTRSADLSAGAGFRIAGSRRLMHSDDKGHADIDRLLPLLLLQRE